MAVVHEEQCNTTMDENNLGLVMKSNNLLDYSMPEING